MRKKKTDEKKVNIEVFKFYKTFFDPKINAYNALIQYYLNHIEIPKLTQEQLQKGKGVITEGKL